MILGKLQEAQAEWRAACRRVGLVIALVGSAVEEEKVLWDGWRSSGYLQSSRDSQDWVHRAQRAGVTPGRPLKTAQEMATGPLQPGHPHFLPLGDQRINSRSAARLDTCLLLPQLESAMQPPMVCSCTVLGSPGQRHLLIQ